MYTAESFEISNEIISCVITFREIILLLSEEVIFYDKVN